MLFAHVAARQEVACCAQYGLARTPGTAWFLKPGERHWLQQRQDAAAAAAAARTGSGAGQLVGAHLWAVGQGAVRMRPSGGMEAGWGVGLGL